MPEGEHHHVPCDTHLQGWGQQAAVPPCPGQRCAGAHRSTVSECGSVFVCQCQGCMFVGRCQDVGQCLWAGVRVCVSVCESASRCVSVFVGWCQGVGLCLSVGVRVWVSVYGSVSGCGSVCVGRSQGVGQCQGVC